MPTSLTVGDVTVIALDDGEGMFFRPRAGAFPGATAAHWRRADERDPGAVRDGEWLLRFRCFALRLAGGRVVLVDAGIGDTDAPAKAWAPVPGRLPVALAATGVAPDEVDTVVLTHLHSDHIGWAVRGDTPYFRNARYLIQSAEADSLAAANPELAAWLLGPLRRTGQLCTVDGETPLADGLRVLATPGHTPGHQSVLLETAEDAVLFTGDLLVHMVQLVDPALAYALEADQAAARTSRTDLLRALAAPGARVRVTLATPHFGEPFVRL